MYDLERLFENSGYRDLCNHFLSLTEDESILSILKEIFYNGEYQNFTFNSNIMNRDNPDIEISRRASLAYLLINNKETFDMIITNGINLFHGTNAVALPSILKYGLNSMADLEKMNINTVTGEKSTRMSSPRKFISFTDVLDIARDYSYLPPDISKNDLSFEVIIGTTTNEVNKNGKYNISSEIPEVGAKKIPVESIKTIFVPSDKINFVKKLLPNDNILVCGIDNYEEKFYYIDEYGEIEIHEEVYQKLKTNINTHHQKKTFHLSEIIEITKKQFKELKSKLNEGGRTDVQPERAR